jgi:molybdopterin-guanine dinucleotide biosynthesis protein A
LAWLGLEQIPDAVPGAGPLAGIVAGLQCARTSLVAVAAVDMPHASEGVFCLLAERWQGEAAVVPVTDRGREPLHAVYSVRAAPKLQARLESGERSVLRCLAGLRVQEVTSAEWAEADPAGTFARNLNRPEDLP